MRYRVVRHHEMDVDATDEEDARRQSAAWEPTRVSVTPLDIEALSKYRTALLQHQKTQRAVMADTEARIAEVEQEMRDVQTN